MDKTGFITIMLTPTESYRIFTKSRQRRSMHGPGGQSAGFKARDGNELCTAQKMIDMLVLIID